ncbi:MAG: hypothetical protein WCF96_09940 [Eubacteriales bacterium]
MNIFTKAIVSNSDMIKSYKTCREKADVFGKIFIMKNNQPDAVLFSIAEYERIAELIEYCESLDPDDVAKVIEDLPLAGLRKKYSVKSLRKDVAEDLLDKTSDTFRHKDGTINEDDEN